MREPSGLRGDRRGHVGITGPDGGHGDSGTEIDQRIAVDVDDDATVGVDGIDRYRRPDTRGDRGPPSGGQFPLSAGRATRSVACAPAGAGTWTREVMVSDPSVSGHRWSVAAEGLTAEEGGLLCPPDQHEYGTQHQQTDAHDEDQAHAEYRGAASRFRDRGSP